MLGSAVFRTGVAPGGALAGPWVKNELWNKARSVPSLDLRFAENKSLVDATTGQNLVTFTRASSGTYVDSQGVIQRATTNLLLRSEEFDNASWATVNATVTANQTIAPNGTLTADQFVENSAGIARLGQVVAATPGVFYTASIYLKAGTNSIINWREDAEDVHGIQINLATGSITNGTGTIVPVGNDWYRVSFTGSVSGTTFKPEIRAVNSPGTIFLWGAQLEQSSTVGEYIPTTSTINSAPRFDHNPTTGESLGLLVEEQRTNSIRNNTMVGAVAGTPGTLPTNWGESLTGLSRQVVEVGTQNGIDYIDFRFFGTTAGTQFISRWDGIAVPVANGQTWTLSAWISLISGTLPSGNVVLSANLYTSGSSYIGDTTLGQIKPLIGATLSRLSGTATINAATAALARPYIYFLAANGEAVDFTLRIGMPQFEQGAFATSVIPTTTSAVTRSADVASITGSNFGVSRTNLLLRSEEFDNASWTKGSSVSVSANTVIAPNGTLTADTVTADSGFGVFQTITSVIGVNYSNSIYVKAGTAASMMFRDDTGAGRHIIFNPLTGVITSTAGTLVSSGSQAVGDGWYRYWMVYAADTTSVRGIVRPNSAGSAQTFVVWGAQLETGSTATAYIPTTTAAVTVVESSWYRQDEGTFYSVSETLTGVTATNRFILEVNTGTGSSSDKWDMRRTGSTAVRTTARIGGVSTADRTESLASSVARAAAGANGASVSLAVNGGIITPVANTVGAMPAVAQMQIGNGGDATTLHLNGTIRRLTYWPRRLPNETLQGITQ